MKNPNNQYKGRPVGIPATEYQKQQTSKRFKGVPKPESQRQKMSEASKGKPKSAEHAANIAKAHIERHKQLKSIMDQYNVTKKEAIVIYKAQKVK